MAPPTCAPVRVFTEPLELISPLRMDTLLTGCNFCVFLNCLYTSPLQCFMHSGLGLSPKVHLTSFFHVFKGLAHCSSQLQAVVRLLLYIQYTHISLLVSNRIPVLFRLMVFSGSRLHFLVPPSAIRGGLME